MRSPVGSFLMDLHRETKGKAKRQPRTSFQACQSNQPLPVERDRKRSRCSGLQALMSLEEQGVLHPQHILEDIVCGFRGNSHPSLSPLLHPSLWVSPFRCLGLKALSRLGCSSGTKSVHMQAGNSEMWPRYGKATEVER